MDVRRNFEQKDYHEAFEFKLTVGDNIICQRYFKINNFNPLSLNSYELLNTIQRCTEVIDRNLKSKTQTYLELYAPMIFNTVEEMNTYFENPKHCESMRYGYGIVVKDSDVDYVWNDKNKVVPCTFKFDNGELSKTLGPEDRNTYKFAFCMHGKEVCSAIWEGIYPKYVRNSIDLSNKKGKLDEGESLYTIGYESYLDYKMCEGKTDLVWGLIKDICYVCSVEDNNYYTTKDTYGTKEYKNSKSLSNYFSEYLNWYNSRNKRN